VNTMQAALAWTTGNAAAFASMVSAVIAASVALLVFAVTQFLSAKQKRREFLTPKLEELFLLLNQVAEENQSSYVLVRDCLLGDWEAKEQLLKMDHLDLYGHRTAKKIVMYVMLYFPELAPTHQRMFREQRELNDLIHQVSRGAVLPQQDVLMAAGSVGHCVRMMTGEIINNRDRLIRDVLFARRYRRTTDEEFENIPPAPQTT
jgi:hypothetical protein